MRRNNRIASSEESPAGLTEAHVIVLVRPQKREGWRGQEAVFPLCGKRSHMDARVPSFAQQQGKIHRGGFLSPWHVIQ